MSKNVSTVDRVVRLVAGAVALGVAVAVGASTVAGIILAVLAAVLVVTAAVGFCPLYRVLGISTVARRGVATPSGQPR